MAATNLNAPAEQKLSVDVARLTLVNLRKQIEDETDPQRKESLRDDFYSLLDEFNNAAD